MTEKINKIKKEKLFMYIEPTNVINEIINVKKV